MTDSEIPEGWKITPKVVDAWIEAIKDEKKWLLRLMWADRLGAERWDPRHGTTQPFKPPGKLQKEGAVSALEFLKTRLEMIEKEVWKR